MIQIRDVRADERVTRERNIFARRGENRAPAVPIFTTAHGGVRRPPASASCFLTLLCERPPSPTSPPPAVTLSQLVNIITPGFYSQEPFYVAAAGVGISIAAAAAAVAVVAVFYERGPFRGAKLLGNADEFAHGRSRLSSSRQVHSRAMASLRRSRRRRCAAKRHNGVITGNQATPISDTDLFHRRPHRAYRGSFAR